MTHPDAVLCMSHACDREALDYWWISTEQPEASTVMIFRCFCTAHADAERAADQCGFPTYVPGSDAGPDHA